ncbi:MAG TPA: Rrf2 family transcriptional regulator [Bacteroidales bacterium]|nr:Rrf2 family transcriptional regulator [Bacteroidales bacterium]
MAKIINVSVAAVLAIHSMAFIAGNKQRLKVDRIAAITGLSRNHLAKALQQLVRNNYITSGRGPNGGFELKIVRLAIVYSGHYRAVHSRIRKITGNQTNIRYNPQFIGL